MDRFSPPPPPSRRVEQPIAHLADTPALPPIRSLVLRRTVVGGQLDTPLPLPEGTQVVITVA